MKKKSFVFKNLLSLSLIKTKFFKAQDVLSGPESEAKNAENFEKTFLESNCVAAARQHGDLLRHVL